MSIFELRYDDISIADRLLAKVALRPGHVVIVATAAASVIGWSWLVLSVGVVAGTAPGSATATQNFWLPFSAVQVLPTGLRDVLVALCSPATGSNAAATFAASLGMWLVMSVAMMLPSAAPMLRTYADIAQAAAQKNQPVRSVWTLAGGYLFVWSLFAVAAAGAQTALLTGGVVAAIDAPATAAWGGAVLIFAGGYQFSSLKHACLEKCRNPFAVLFGRWSTKRAAVFRLGVEQGVFCVGCCWALMLVMFAVGTMNLAWMALFALFTMAEKTGTGKVATYGVGVALTGWGGVLLTLAALA